MVNRRHIVPPHEAGVSRNIYLTLAKSPLAKLPLKEQNISKAIEKTAELYFKVQDIIEQQDIKRLITVFDSHDQGNSSSCEQMIQDDADLKELKAQSSALELMLEKLRQQLYTIKEVKAVHAEKIQQITNLEAVNRNKTEVSKGQRQLDPIITRVTQGAYNTIFYRSLDVSLAQRTQNKTIQA